MSMTHSPLVRGGSGGAAATTTILSSSLTAEEEDIIDNMEQEEEDNTEVREDLGGGGEDLTLMDDLTTDSCSVTAARVVKRKSAASSKRIFVTGTIFNRNKYVLASVLSSDIKRLLMKILWGPEGGYSRWNKTFSSPPVRADALMSLIEEPRPELLITKSIMDRVEDADCYDRFVAKLIQSGAMSNQLKRKVVQICRNKYLPPVPGFMIRLVRNRKVADQEKLLKALDVGPYYNEHDDNDDDGDFEDDDDDFFEEDDRFVGKYLRDDATLERGLSRWILKKQRSKDYNAHCDTLGQDSNALADFERGITTRAKMPLLRLSPNVVRAIRDTCGRAKLRQLVRKMRQDLGVVSEEEEEGLEEILDNAASSRRRLGGLIADWLLARQRRGLIFNHLKCEIMCYVYALGLDKSLGLASTRSQQRMGDDDDNDAEEEEEERGEAPNWRLRWEDLECRVQSFGREWARRHNQSALSMAQSGFRLSSLRPETNPGQDLVTCYQCWIGLRKWQDSDDPDLEHLWRTCEERRQCPYMLKKLGRAMVNFIEALQKVGDPKPQDMNHARDLYGAQWF